MSALTDYTEAKILNRILNAQDTGNWALLPNLWVSLHTAATADDGTGTEVTGGSYARVSTAPADWTIVATGTATNANDIDFPAATASWGSIVNIAVWDDPTAGNMLFHGALSESRTVNSGSQAKFLAGELDFDFDDGGGGSAFADYAENKIMQKIFKNGDDGDNIDPNWTVIPDVYIALFTAAPDDTGGGTEVTGGSYARKIVTAGFTVTNGHADNTSDITFVQATADWGTITHMGIFDAITSGNLLFHAALTESRAVNNGGQFKFLATDLDIDID